MLGFQHWYVYPTEGNRFSVTFEQFAESVSNWPGMFFEMDGSFVWSISLERNPGRAQIDGMVYDRDDRIEYLDLKGNARPEDWLALFGVLVGPQIVSDPSEQLRIFDNAKQEFVSWKVASTSSSVPPLPL
ncbi:hypothetical protein SH467x_002109 [Pirellulaceae bacterium SH467]